LYIGTLAFGDQVIENYCEPIIDRSIWNAVQAKVRQFAQHKNLKGPNHPRRINSSYLLSGLVYCARCGSPLFGAPAAQRKHSNGSPSTYERYACTRAYRRRDCDQGQFPQGILDNAVVDTLREYVLLPEILSFLQKQIQSSQAKYLARIEEQCQELNTTLVGLKRRITHLANAIAESGHTRALLEKLANLEADETTLLAQIAELERQANIPAPALNDDQLATLAQHFQDILAGSDLRKKQRLLRCFIDRITVDRDGSKIIGVISYYFPPPVDKSPPEDTAPMPGGSLGAPLHRHSFTVSFTAAMRSYNRKRP
jgi:hypothetical protein